MSLDPNLVRVVASRVRGVALCLERIPGDTLVVVTRVNVFKKFSKFSISDLFGIHSRFYGVEVVLTEEHLT